MMPVRTSFDFAAAVFGPRWVCVRFKLFVGVWHFVGYIKAVRQ
jgi:hypothetical protein